MKRFLNIFMFLVLAIWNAYGQGVGTDGYDPENPGDPQVPEQKYILSLGISPDAGGSVNFDQRTCIEGERINVRAYSYNDYKFVNWKEGDSIVSLDASFYYEMPKRNVKLTAYFRYDPYSPDTPDSEIDKVKITLTASPANAGSFNFRTVKVQSETYYDLYAYPDNYYDFEGWYQNGQLISKENPYGYFTGKNDVEIEGRFVYNPEAPQNPGANPWNKETGLVIVDDFKPGKLISSIDEAIGGRSNRPNVSHIIVAGKMSGGDWGIANYFENCAIIDLKRTYGYTEVPNYAFDYCRNLQNIILPSCVERIGYRAFEECSNLSEITCYSVTPPVVESYAFYGIAEGAVLHVLTSSTPLYSAAEEWKNFTILPLLDEVRTLTVKLPGECADGRYKNMWLELINQASGHKFKYVISDRLLYTFNGLLEKETYAVVLKTPMGVELSSVADILVGKDDMEVTLSDIRQMKDVRIRVFTPTGEDVTSNTNVVWFDEEGRYLKQGTILSQMTAGSTVKYRVSFNRILGLTYEFPKEQEYLVQEDNNEIIITLKPLTEKTIYGVVKDIDSGFINHAVVTVSQKVNGEFMQSSIVKTDEKGKWSQTVFDGPVTLNFSADDYISQTLEVPVIGDSLDMGTCELRTITGAVITLKLTYQPAQLEGSATKKTEWYPDYANIGYNIYNETKQKTIEAFNVQYPRIVLLEEVEIGDCLKLTAYSVKNEFTSVETTATINENNSAESTINIVGLGAIQADFALSDNSKLTAMLYDSQGNLIKNTDYVNAKASFNDLVRGKYTLISMAKSSLFNSISRLSQLKASGLVEGTDFVKNDVEVKDGFIQKVHNEIIPFLDESKLYYTGTNTSFAINKPSITVGNYLTLSSKIDFNELYSGKVSDVKLIVDLSENVELVDNSLMIGYKLAQYSLEGQRLIVSLGSYYQDIVKFCVIPTLGGEYRPTAFVEFTMDDKTVLQPIGSAYCNVKDLSISVPSVIAKNELTVSGTAMAHSHVTIYDSNQIIGETEALGNGQWSNVCKLDNPYNLSNHEIHAKVLTKDGMNLKSESVKCMYDENSIRVSKVKMYHDNPEIHKNFEMTFDFINPSQIKENYIYYIFNKNFTFTIDFTQNDTTKISDVVLYVKTAKSGWHPVEAIYNAKLGMWTASAEFGNRYDGDLPINVSVDYRSNIPPCGDSRKVNDIIKVFDLDLAVDSNLTQLLNELEQSEFNDMAKFEELFDYLEITETQNNVIPSDIKDFIESAYTVVGGIEYTMDKGVLTFADDKGNTFYLTSSTVEEQSLNEDEMKEFYEVPLNDNTILYIRSIENNIEVIYGNRFISFKTSRIGNDVPVNNMAFNADEFLAKWSQYRTVLEDLQNIPKIKELTNKLKDLCFNGLATKEKNLETCKNIKKAYNRGELTSKQIEQLDAVKLNKLLKELPEEIKVLKKYLNRLNLLFKALDVAAIINDINAGIESRIEWFEIIRTIESIDCPNMDKLAAKAKKYSDLVAFGYDANFTANLYSCTGLDKILGLLVTAGVASGIGAQVSAATIANIADAIILALNDFFIIQGGVNQINDIKWKSEIRLQIPNIKCETPKPTDVDPQPEGKGEQSNNPDKEFAIDPSGYVYEAVQSNRVEGVTASCYYKEFVEDMYGDKHENVVLWNAEEYAQRNPLFTDENGMYRWDVPQGLWQVKFEKAGYQTTYSEWLPVPPPQLEVNIPISQLSQPSVKNARAYDEGIEIQFSKYMDPATLNTENIKVTRNDSCVSGKINFEDLEKADNSGSGYVSKIRFVPDSVFLNTDKVTLVVSRMVKSYADIPMTEDYSQEFDIVREVKEIAVDSMYNVVYGKNTTITVSALPSDAAIGKKITAKSSSPLISTVTAEAVLDENSQAKFVVTGELPGIATINFAIEDVSVKGQTIINVVTKIAQPNVPTASRASGTEVFRNTAIELYSDIEDAKILYTLDGSCPCDSGALLYTKPIVIDKDITIKAMVVDNEGNESDIARFDYKIKRTNLGIDMAEGWTWISHNMESPLDVHLFEGKAERVQSQVSEVVNDPAYGLVGDLFELNATEAYKVNASSKSQIVLNNYQFNARDNKLTIEKGWNWIGYPMSQTMTVDEAFANAIPAVGDIVIGLSGQAEYTGEKWTGNLNIMVPGLGYMYKASDKMVFGYNTDIVSKAASLYAVTSNVNVAPWVANIHAYPNVMPMTVIMHDSDYMADGKSYYLGAFSGTECRGVGAYADGRWFITVHGNGNETITFKAIDKLSEEVYDIRESIPFVSDNIGTYALPFDLNFGSSTGVGGVYSDNLTVSPLVAEYNITVGLDGAEMKKVAVFNTYGEQVMAVTDCGTETVMNVSNLSSGVYIVTVVADNKFYYKKFIKK